MWDWVTWNSLGTVWDWGSKMGLGAVGSWLLQRLIARRDKAVDRGHERVDAARPELVPMGGGGGQYVVQLQVENRGRGTARTRRIGFTGIEEIAIPDEVPPGQARLTAALNVERSPFFTAVHDGRAEITLVYADRYDNEYKVNIPVTRQRRADGGFNMQIDFRNYQNIGPRLSKAKLRKIGTS